MAHAVFGPTATLTDLLFHNVEEEKKKEITTLVCAIGINYIGTANQLNACIDDVKELLRYVFIPYFGKERTHVSLLTDEVGNSNQPTRDNILKTMKSISEATHQFGNINHVVFDYSGHGSWSKADKNESKFEKDGRDETIVPVDWEKSGDITDNEIRDWRLSMRKTVTVWMIVDACHSGTITDARYQWVYEGENIRQIKHRERPKSKDSALLIAISGCRDNQYSEETPQSMNTTDVKDTTGGILTTSIQKVFESEENLTWGDVIRRVSRVVKEYGEQQPSFTSNRKLKLSDVVFIRSEHRLMSA